MIQKWKYMDYEYEVDDEDPSTYKTILGDMLEYNDVYEYLDQYMIDNFGGGADVFLQSLWDGPEYTINRIRKGFMNWLLEDMGTVNEILESNAEKVESKEGEE